MVRLLFIFFLFVSCSTRDTVHFQEKSRHKKEELISELQAIDSLEDIIQRADRFKTLYLELTHLSIEIQKYQKKHSTEWELEAEDVALSDELRFEFMRIYKILGAKELMEKYQMPAVVRLDAFEKKEARFQAFLQP